MVVVDGGVVVRDVGRIGGRVGSGVVTVPPSFVKMGNQCSFGFGWLYEVGEVVVKCIQSLLVIVVMVVDDLVTFVTWLVVKNGLRRGVIVVG